MPSIQSESKENRPLNYSPVERAIANIVEGSTTTLVTANNVL